MAGTTWSLDAETLSLLRSGLRIVALRSLSDVETAEEAVQETLVRGMEAIQDQRLENPGKVGAYFRGILRHVIVDTLRDRTRMVSMDQLPHPPRTHASADALHLLITKEQTAAVTRLLSELTPRARECLVLSYYEGLAPREIAARLGEPPARIRKRRSRALEKARSILRTIPSAEGGHETSARGTYESRGADPESPLGRGGSDEE